MGNTLKIAGKEFKDLLSDRIMLVVVAAFLLYILVDLSHIRDLLASGFFNYDPNLNQANPAANLAETMLNQLTFMLSRYGAILGIAVGFLSIAGERHGGALNALVAKPVTRDAIIVGKTGGALGFLLCVFALAAAFLTSGLMILASATIAPVIVEYAARMPVAVLTALLYTMVFFFLSMAISLLIDNYAFALILSLLAWSVSQLMTSYTFTGYIAAFLGDEKGIGQLIMSLSPDGMIRDISYNVLGNFRVDFAGAMGLAGFDLQKLLFILNLMGSAVLKLLIILIALAAIAFVAFRRRDIA